MTRSFSQSRVCTFCLFGTANLNFLMEVYYGNVLMPMFILFLEIQFAASYLCFIFTSDLSSNVQFISNLDRNLFCNKCNDYLFTKIFTEIAANLDSSCRTYINLDVTSQMFSVLSLLACTYLN